MGEKFRLMWHTYTTHGQELFRNLLETQQFTDVTLISDDQKQYKVHKFILSACTRDQIHHPVLLKILRFFII